MGAVRERAQHQQEAVSVEAADTLCCVVCCVAAHVHGWWLGVLTNACIRNACRHVYTYMGAVQIWAHGTKDVQHIYRTCCVLACESLRGYIPNVCIYYIWQ